MKVLLLILSSYILLFAATPQEREAKLQNVVYIEISHSLQIEKRISKINLELERKALLRIEKSKLREARLAKLNQALQVKADAREKNSK
jgi:hypothetical protein